jgi:hypothetical protein
VHITFSSLHLVKSPRVPTTAGAAIRQMRSAAVRVLRAAVAIAPPRGINSPRLILIAIRPSSGGHSPCKNIHISTPRTNSLFSFTLRVRSRPLPPQKKSAAADDHCNADHCPSARPGAGHDPRTSRDDPALLVRQIGNSTRCSALLAHGVQVHEHSAAARHQLTGSRQRKRRSVTEGGPPTPGGSPPICVVYGVCVRP